MKVRHKKLRRGSIAFTCGAFRVGTDGMLSPDPTEAQWRQFGTAQMYFEVIPEVALERRMSSVSALADIAAAVAAPLAAEHAPMPLYAPTPEPMPEPAPNEEVFSMDDEDDEDDGEDAQMFSDDVDPNADTPEGARYSGMSTEELRTLCRERGIRTARVNKADLISLLNASDLGV